MRRLSARSTLFAFASAAALLACPLAASAQDAGQTPPGADEEATALDEIVVTGTRTPGRSRLDTIAPVDVITGETLTRQGTGTELAAGLAGQAPSISFPRPAITDGSDHVRPATLRGLAPDQTLVLVNGQRGHVAALVAVNGSIGRGSTSFDLNTIPAVALGSVEVLRDGASAQYGADAIAGVVNLRLREARSGGAVIASMGGYDTDFTTARGEHSAQDGNQVSLASWVGLPIGEEGFLTLSAEIQDRDPTNRSDYAAPTAVLGGDTTTQLARFGDPSVNSGSLWYNMAVPFGGGGWELYSFGGAQKKESEAAATARAFNDARNVQAIYPSGFVPIIATDIEDYNLYGGLRGDAGGWAWDFAAGWGRNALDYHVQDSLNASFGAASQTEFDAGGLEYDQLTLGVDAVRGFDFGLATPINVALGLEYRRESFGVHAGEEASYARGPINAATGSQGFPGFRPANEVDEDRHNWSAFVDVEGNLTDAFSFGVAGRYEDYSDFGDQFTGKVSARYDFTPNFALRAAASTGFKAPALQQQFFSYTSTNLVATAAGVQLIEAGTFRVDDPVALALGSQPLEPETSENFSVGGVLRFGGFELTVDAYRIDVDDRIVYSESLGVSRPSQSAASVAAVQTLLAPFGVSAARFFLNGVDTTTEGVDVVARYRWASDFGRFDFTAAGNFNQTEVTAIPAQPDIAVPASDFFLFDRSNILAYEQGTPEEKIVGSVDWDYDRFGATLKATSYDSVLIANNNPALDYDTGSDVLVDLEGRFDLNDAVGFAVGVNNLTDEYPEFTPANINGSTGSVGFPSYSPYGFNGRFFYGRMTFTF